MALQVQIAIHGVPAGQKWLCTDPQDEAYIKTFYNPKDWDVPEFMKVERMADQVYYTFVKCGHVSASDGRSGSYFGITLKMNAYYADIQNIYSILKAFYKKLCVGTFVSDNGQNVKFIVSDFKGKEPQFQSICKLMLDTIGTFTSQHDLQGVNQIPVSKGTVAAINLDECDEATARQMLSSAGSLKVSPFYFSQAVQRMSSDYQRQLQEMQQKQAKDVEQLQQSYQAQSLQMQQQFNQREKELSGGRKGLQDRIAQLEQQLDATRRQMQQQIDQAKAQSQHQQEDYNAILTSLSELSRKYGSGKNPVGPKPPVPPQKPPAEQPKKHSAWKKFLSHYGLGLGVLIVLIVFVCTNVSLSIQNKDTYQDTYKMLVEQQAKIDSIAVALQSSGDTAMTAASLTVQKKADARNLKDDSKKNVRDKATASKKTKRQKK